jgi:hypothetical protein
MARRVGGEDARRGWCNHPEGWTAHSDPVYFEGTDQTLWRYFLG